MGKVISILNQKGGTGKTTTTINLGRAMSKYHHKVLMIDMDPQASLSYALGVEPKLKSTSDILLGDLIKEATVELADNLFLIPSSIELASTELMLVNVDNREFQLVRALKASEYDMVLIDCPPSLSLLTVNALTASDYVLIPMQLEYLSLKGLRLIIDTIDQVKEVLNEDLRPMGILPIMVDARKNITSAVLEDIRKNFSIPLFKTHIRTDVKIAEAPNTGKSVLDYSPTSKGSIDYKNLAKEVIKRKN